MTFVNFLHSLLQPFIKIVHVFKMKKVERDLFPSKVTLNSKTTLKIREKGVEIREEREGMSKCMWEGRDEHHFAETQQ